MKKMLFAWLLTAALMGTAGVASAQSYALHYQDADRAAITDGDTIDVFPEDWEYEIGLAQISFYVENLSDVDMLTDQRVEVKKGPSGFTFDVCAGGMCPVPPAVPDPYTVPAHSTYMEPITIKAHLSAAFSGKALLKLTVGQSPLLNGGVVVYIRLNLGETNGIVSPATARPVAYPNPTTGKVWVDGAEYDLGESPAGIYMLPAKRGAAKVIKL